jgi:hypothetical protein
MVSGTPSVAGGQNSETPQTDHLNTPATWLAFGCLLLAGTLLAFAKTLTLVVLAIVGFCIIWVRLCLRYPRTMFVITAFLRGLLSRR